MLKNVQGQDYGKLAKDSIIMKHNKSSLSDSLAMCTQYMADRTAGRQIEIDKEHQQLRLELLLYVFASKTVVFQDWRLYLYFAEGCRFRLHLQGPFGPIRAPAGLLSGRSSK